MLRTLIILFLLFSQAAKVLAEDNVRLQLKWFHQYQFAGYYAAQEKGFYKEYGINLEIIERQPSLSAIDSVLNDQAEFGVADSSIVLNRLQGKPLVIASTIFQSSPLVFMTLENQNITSPYDLVGKKIMFQKSVDDASLQALMTMFNITDDKYDFIPHSFNDWALRDNIADVMSAYRSNQPHLYETEGIKVNLIDPKSYGIDFYGDLLFTTEELVTNNKDLVDRFVAASLKGWLYAMENQEEIAQLIIDKYASNSNKQQLLFEAQATFNMIKHQQVKIGTSYPARFASIANTYKELGLAPENSDLDGLLLSDYEETPLNFTKETLYLLLAIFILVACIVVAQFLFNRKLVALVDSKTEALNKVNEKLFRNNTLLKEKNKQLDNAIADVEKASKEKTMFLANMSHEIRTPMNAVMGVLQLLEKQNLQGEALKLLQHGRSSAKALLSIINDILDISKVEAGRIELELLPIDLCEIAESICVELKPLAMNNANSLTIKVADNFESHRIGDPVRIKQIILNLVSNAVKFTSNGKVELVLSGNESEDVKIEVVDTGIGMTEAQLARIFIPFEQADKSTTRQFGGTGLGMAICANLVELMQGKISVKSELKKGSTFEVTLPLDFNKHYIDNQNSEQEYKAPLLKDSYILIVEDNEINQEVLKSMLQDTCANITAVFNGQEAVEIVDTIKFDLILMDIQMPIMDGTVACNIIKQRYPDIPIIALTANVMQTDIDLYLATGFDGFVGKPIDIASLYKLIAEHVESN